MYRSRDRLVIFDADGTLIDAFPVVDRSFMLHGMDIGDLERFQRRRKLLKYIGGLREFPKNLRQQFDKGNRKRLKRTLTDVYREAAQPYPGMVSLLQRLIDTPDIRVGIVSRNVTIEPEETLGIVLRRFGIDRDGLDFLRCIPLGDGKATEFRAIRERYGINPLRAYVCGDEYRDYADANAAGMQAIIASYGFEDHGRLVGDYNIPPELIAGTPAELAHRLYHALDLVAPGDGNAHSPEI
jgi:phosphoglycolate phosphatase